MLPSSEHTFQVDVDDIVPLSLAHVEDHAVPQNAGDMDQNVQPAEGINSGLNDALPAVHGGDGLVNRRRIAAEGLDLFGDLVGRLVR